ncbi:MAG: hypothetical protein FJ009_15530 [Chloroflexi bacterium]|nr:hypothetical protein [Chloroflexota bacterium]
MTSDGQPMTENFPVVGHLSSVEEIQMRINPFLMPILLIVALLGTTFAAQALGAWSVSGKTAVDVTNLTPTDLKGWMTIQQVIDGVKLSKEEVYAAGNIPADVPPSTALKDLEGLVPGFETSVLRDALTKKLSGAAPASAAQTPVAATPIATISATRVSGSGSGSGATPTPLPAGQALPASQIKGSMSLKSVSQQCVVPLDKILAGLNLPADTNPETLLKDLVAQGKIKEVSDVQQVVEKLQAK